MNCFLLPAHARDAHWQFFKCKRMSSSTSTPQPKRARQDLAATVAALAQQVKDLASRLEGSSSAPTTVQHDNPNSSPGLSAPEMSEAEEEFCTALTDVLDVNAP